MSSRFLPTSFEAASEYSVPIFLVQIAWGRQSSNQPLRSQDRTAIDYYNVVLRHLPEPINGPNQPVLPYLQQSNYHAQNEVLNIVVYFFK